jgi:cobalt-zinc-cadmium efflux system outer membrane protein
MTPTQTPARSPNKTKNTLHAALLALLGMATSLHAVNLTMEGAVQAALMGNRPLAVAQFEIDKARARLLQSGLLPNPDFTFTGMSDFVADGDGEGAFTVGLSQGFPITARLGIARELRRVEVAQALREIRNHERLLIAQVQSVYVQIQAARMREKSAIDARQSAIDLVALSERRIAAGQGSLAEGALLRVEERKWWASSVASKTEAETKLLDLKTLLGLPADTPLNLTESLGTSVNSLRKNFPNPGQVQRPDVELALLEIDRAGAEIRLARAETWEGVTLGLEYTYDHAVDEPSGLGTSQFLGVSVSIPLPVWDTKRGEVAEGKAAQNQARAKIRALELEVGNTIATASRKVSLYDEHLKSYRTSTEGVIATSEKELASGFDQGRVDLRDLLQLRAQSAALRVDAVTILENIALALIDWNVATGSHPTIARPYTEAQPLKSKKQP